MHLSKTEITHNLNIHRLGFKGQSLTSINTILRWVVAAASATTYSIQMVDCDVEARRRGESWATSTIGEYRE